MSSSSVPWQRTPAEHDYPAASSYLSLLAPAAVVETLVAGLRQAPIEHFLAKDVLRAAGLPLLPTDNPHVAKDLKKVRAGTALSPVLLVRGDLATGRAAQVADGYHRICASYHVDENTPIPCQIVDPPLPS
jgi:hypothetical protein